MSLNLLSLLNIMIAFIATFVSSVQVSYPPIWVSSNYIRAGNQDLFTTLTGSGVINSFNFIFSSSLSGVPHLGYGIKAYQGNLFIYVGNDYFGQ